MKYDSHILNVIRSDNFYLYNIHKARAKLSFDITISLINSLVFIRFDYYNSLFVFVPDIIMIKFEKIQRSAVRVLYKIKNNRNTNTGSNYISISNIMLTLVWLRYRDICKLKLLSLAHKAIYTGAPKYLAELLSIFNSNRPRRDCHAMKLIMPHTNSCFGNSAFSVAVPTLWNLLRILFVRQLLDLNSKVDYLDII